MAGFVFVWGRTPTSNAASVYIERKTAGKWKRVKTMRADRYGIFKLRVTALPEKTAYMRARLADGSDVSTPFALKAPKKGWTGSAPSAPASATGSWGSFSARSTERESQLVSSHRHELTSSCASSQPPCPIQREPLALGHFAQLQRLGHRAQLL
jgi:hypothetical protein